MSKIVGRRLGTGIGYRVSLDSFISQNENLIDVLEVIPEHYSQGDKVFGMRKLAVLRERFNLVVHGIASNIVSSSRPSKNFLRLSKQIVEIAQAPYFSDHAMMTGADGFALGHLSPNLYDRQTLKHALSNAKELEEAVGVPLVVEYSTYSTRFAGSIWTPEEFYLELVNTHDTLGILIDLSNVWYNSSNFNFDPRSFLQQLPADRVVHVHMAGGEVDHGFWIDSHSHPVHNEVFALLEHLCEFSDPDVVIIERDSNYGQAVSDLPSDIQKAKAILNRKVRNGI